MSTPSAARPELERRNRKDAGAAAVINQVLALQILFRQPLQTQRRGRVVAGAEGEAGIEDDVDGLGLGRGNPARADPEVPAELERFVVRLPRRRPVLVGEQVGFRRRRFGAEQLPQLALNYVNLGIPGKQAGDPALLPHRRFLPVALDPGVAADVLDADGNGAAFFERVAEPLRLLAHRREPDLEPGHKFRYEVREVRGRKAEFFSPLVPVVRARAFSASNGC